KGNCRIQEDYSSQSGVEEMIFGIYAIRKEGAEPEDNPDDVGIILEGVQVLDDLGNVPFAVAMLFALVYALNLSYPSELRYTCEALQKIIMELDGNRLSRKAQALKTLPHNIFLCYQLPEFHLHITL
uniref:Sterile alpha motif domain containing 3 n=1 Tax=Labrus bergylta TaxID=56723 RepID=A0A3Q3EEI5_9LABR